jgi:hypothetical protein
MGHEMATSISVSEETRNCLVTMKMNEGFSSIEELLQKMIVERKRFIFLEASKKFRSRMNGKKMSVKDLVG